MRHGVDNVKHHPVGNPKRNMMNIAARFSLSKKPRFIDPKGKKPND
jgi:hypothetical protein